MIDQAVYELLQADAAVAAAIADRLHFAERPQSYALPAIVIQRGSAVRSHHLKGADGLTTGFVRVTCLAGSYLAAADLARLVNAAIDGWAGDVTLQGPDGQVTLRVGYILQDSEDDIPSEHRDGEGRITTHGVQIDLRYAHREPVPV